MSTEPATAVTVGHHILEPGRIVADPAILRLIPKEKLRDIAVIHLRAQLAAIEQQVRVQQETIKILQELKF